MPLPDALARFNRVVTNRLTAPLAARLGGFGIVVHVGRSSGREYRTPVNVFRDGETFTIALTYGAQADWVRNVLAAGGCQIVHRGVRHDLTAPRIVGSDPGARAVPAPARLLLRLLAVEDYLLLDPAS